MQPYGLVMAGGMSTRMGTDKGLLNYHGLPQRYHVYNMLEEVCGEAYISCNQEQAESIPAPYKLMVDDAAYAGRGPMAGVLTAFKLEPNRSFVAIGCDYPGLEIAHIALLYQGVCSGKRIAWYNFGSKFYEPLLAGYHASMHQVLMEQFNSGNYSLQQLLKTIEAEKLMPDHLGIPQSIDSPEAAISYRKQQGKQA